MGKINRLRGLNKAGEEEIATQKPKTGKLQGHLLCTGALCKINFWVHNVVNTEYYLVIVIVPFSKDLKPSLLLRF